MKKLSIAVAMSGGVDSSVAAALLAKAGYNVVGFTLRLWEGAVGDPNPRPCCSIETAKDAKSVCDTIGVRHHIFDMREGFTREVIGEFEREYLAGRTPNPCVTCNSHVKWGMLWDKVRAIGFERLATGHYARIVAGDEDSVKLMRGFDPLKEQSYFLWRIPVDLLGITLFPLGEMHKSEVRSLAGKFNLPVAEKSESQEVCFIPGDDYRAWLNGRQPDLKLRDLSGDMVDSSGKVLSRHSGYHQFTIGQRKGLGLGGGRKYYVTAIDPETHRVQVGDESELLSSRFKVGKLNILNQAVFNNPADLEVKIRYRDKGVRANVQVAESGSFIVKTSQPVTSVTPGQSAVFYIDDEVLGGGIIMRDLR